MLFSSLYDAAKLSASTVIVKTAGSIIIAIPFIISAGFGIGAIYIALAEAYDSLTAAIILTVAFLVIGLVTMLVVSLWARREQTKRNEAMADARRSAMAAFMLANPGLILGAGKTAVNILRKAPYLAIIPVAAGFLLASARSSSNEEETEDGA